MAPAWCWSWSHCNKSFKREAMNILSSLKLLAWTSLAFAALAQDRPASMDSEFPVPQSPFQPDLTPGYVLIEGDIQVPLSYYATMSETGPQAQSTIFGYANFWPDNIVPYDFVTSGNGAVSV